MQNDQAYIDMVDAPFQKAFETADVDGEEGRVINFIFGPHGLIPIDKDGNEYDLTGGLSEPVRQLRSLRYRGAKHRMFRRWNRMEKS